MAGIVLLVGGKLAVMAAIGPMFGLTQLSALRAGLLIAPGEPHLTNKGGQQAPSLLQGSEVAWPYLVRRHGAVIPETQQSHVTHSQLHLLCLNTLTAWPPCSSALRRRVRLCGIRRGRLPEGAPDLGDLHPVPRGRAIHGSHPLPGGHGRAAGGATREERHQGPAAQGGGDQGEEGLKGGEHNY